jgi:hypothetical protein
MEPGDALPISRARDHLLPSTMPAAEFDTDDGLTVQRVVVNSRG